MKTVPPSKFMEWRGLDRIQMICHEMKCIFRDITKDDFGLDGEIEVVVPKADGSGYETKGGIVKIQGKAGSSYVRSDSAEAFHTPVSRADLELWRTSNFPVLFIVYHPDDDALYWREGREYVRDTPGVWQPPHAIHFRKARDRFTTDVYSTLCDLAGTATPRLVYTQREQLYSNLLRVTALPRVLYSAETDYANADAIREKVHGWTPPFDVVGKRIITPSNLRSEGNVLRPYCRDRHVSDLLVRDWLNDEAHRKVFVYLLNQILGQHLRRCGLTYNREHRRNFFPLTDPDQTEYLRAWYSVRTKRQNRRQIIKFYEYGVDRFWRHLAVNLTFQAFGSSWYLQIIPRYFFTADGRMPWDSEKVGPYTTRIRAAEHNLHVLNQVLFWSDVLADGKTSVEMLLDGRPAIVVNREPATTLTSFAIPSDPAAYIEERTIEQPPLFGLTEWDLRRTDDEDELAQGDEDDDDRN